MILPATLSSKNSATTTSSSTSSSSSSPLEVADSKSNLNQNHNHNHNHSSNTMNGSPMSISNNPSTASNLSPPSNTNTNHHHNHHHHHHHLNHNNIGGTINENTSTNTTTITTTPTTTVLATSPNNNNNTAVTNDRGTLLVDCAGCGSTIMDRYYLSSVDQHWHASCLKCSQCKLNLQAEPSCFSRDGLIFCKSDYYRLFTMRRCNRCGEGIYASELVMRVKDHNVYHIQCFTCAWCNVTLSQGDLYGIRDNLVYCRQHFEMLSASATTTVSGSVPPASSSSPCSTKLSSQLYSLGVMAPSDVLHRQQQHFHHHSPSSPPQPMLPSAPPSSLSLPLQGPPPSPHFHHVNHSPHHGYHHPHAHHHNHSPISLTGTGQHLGHHHHHHHVHHSHHGIGSPPLHLNDATSLTGDQCSTMAATPYTSNPGGLQGGGIGIYSPLSISNLSGASGGPMTPNGANNSNNSTNNNNHSGNGNGTGHHNGQSPTTPQSIRKGRPRKRKNVINNTNNNNNHQHHTTNHHHLGSHGHHHGPPLPPSSQPQDNDTIINSCSHETSTLSPSSARNALSPNGVSNTLDGGPLSGLAASIENSCNSQLSSSSSSVLNLVTHSTSGNGSSGGGGGGGGGGGRTKRMRTSFKHHQLRTMKTYFSVNQNPDAKDLKQLAQKTGLSKRVLQVWFQNARAKWRRNNLKMLPDGQELSLNGQTMLNLGHPSTPSSTMIGSPNGSTRPYSSPSPVMSPSTTETLSHHQPSPMIVATGGCVTPNNNNNNNQPPHPPPSATIMVGSSNVKQPAAFITGHGPPPPPLPPPPNLGAIGMNFQELY